MPPFSRNYRFGLQRLFPASGGTQPYPNNLSDSVQLVKPFTAVDFAHAVSLRRDIQSQAGAAANVTFTHPEAIRGTFQVPVSYTVWNLGPATQEYQISMDVTASAQDDWGNWETIDRAFATGRLPAGFVTVFSMHRIPLIPLPIGITWEAFFPLVPVGNTVRAHLHWVDVPGELIDLAKFFQSPSVGATGMLST